MTLRAHHDTEGSFVSIEEEQEKDSNVFQNPPLIYPS